MHPRLSAVALRQTIFQETSFTCQTVERQVASISPGQRRAWQYYLRNKMTNYSAE